MQKKPPDIIGPIENVETWNTCPKCYKYWKDEKATPGLLHRTRLCDDCYKLYKCCQINCYEIATYMMFWPGLGRRNICELHLNKALNIAQAMGFTLCVEKIE